MTSCPVSTLTGPPWSRPSPACAASATWGRSQERTCAPVTTRTPSPSRASATIWEAKGSEADSSRGPRTSIVT